jgi:SAM-dependent methyltransferase
MEADLVEALLTAGGQAALAAADGLVADGPLAAASALRAAGVDAELAGTALTQASLRRHAIGKFGADAARMYFTRPGLEQATRQVVAGRRAARLAEGGLDGADGAVRRVADLGCGIGADAIALARGGLEVLAVETDPGTAAVARANAAALGLSGRLTVHCGDATQLDLSEVDAVFCDPARRDARGGARVFDPAAFSPPWPFVVGLSQRVPRTVLKLAPGLDHALIPGGAEAEWVSVDGDLVEAALWCGPYATVPRRASVIRRGIAHSLTGSGERTAKVVGVGGQAAATTRTKRYVFDPDPAVVRSHLVAEFATMVDGGLADPKIAYVFADDGAETPYAHCFEVVEQLPFARKQLKAALRARGIGRLEIRKRGVAIEPDQLRRDLKLDGQQAATLVLLRIGATPTALLCRALSTSNEG